MPLSKKAFMPGKLVHTNEILILLGDNWFVEKSAKQACQLIDRRLIGINEHMDKLNKEKTNLLEAIEWTQTLTKVQLKFKFKINLIFYKFFICFKIIILLKIGKKRMH